MKLSSLRQSLQALSAARSIVPASLTDQLVAQYIEKILSDFTPVVESNERSPEERLQILRGLLHANWELIDRTCLSYTALPGSLVTSFLMDVAQYVAEEENKKGCGVLSRSVAPRDASDVEFSGYNSVCIRVNEQEDAELCLLTVEGVIAVNKDSALEQMGTAGFNSGYLRAKQGEAGRLYYLNVQKEVCTQLMTTPLILKSFDEHVKAMSGGTTFSSNSPLSVYAKALIGHPPVNNALYYANQQQNTLAPLHCSEAQLVEFDQTTHPTAFPLNHFPPYCGDLATVIQPLSALEVLMPGVSFDRLDGSIDHALYEHIQSEDGERFIPVRCLREARLERAVSLAEYRRLTQHSALTQAVLASQQAYDSIASDTSTLLGQLTELCRQLGVNDAHGGRGQGDNAASGAYPAIIHFMNYYNGLPETEKARIPVQVNEEIETLLALSTDAHRNINATRQLETCIGTRRSTLLTAMNGHDEVLNQISLGGETKASLITQATQCLDSAKQDLMKALDESVYREGRDALGLNRALLSALNTTLSIHSLEDLAVFRALSPDEIREVLQDESLRRQIITHLGTLENWVVFSMGVSSEQLFAWTVAMKQALVAEFIKLPSDLAAVLISADLEKCRVICFALSSEFPHIIQSSHDFGRVLQHLSREQRAVVFDSMRGEWPNIIQSTDDFSLVLQQLSPEQRTVVFELMPREWSNLIQSSVDFVRVLKYLSPEQRTVVFDLMRSKLPNLIQSSVDFVRVLKPLSPEQRTVVFDLMRSEWPNLIKSRYDFGRVLQPLSPEQCRVVIDSMRSEWPNLIQSRVDFAQVLLLNLSPEQCTVVIDSMKSEWSNLIKSSYDFFLVLQHLSSEQRTVVFDFMRSEWPSIIQSSDDFGGVLQYLSPEQCRVVIDSMRSEWPNLIKSGADFGRVLQPLSPVKRTVVFDLIQGEWSNLIKSSDDFDRVLQPLNPEQRTVVFDSMRSECPNLIQSSDDFGRVMKYLSPEQRTVVFDLMRSKWPNLIQSSVDFSWMLVPLSPEQRTVVIDSMRSEWPNLIQSSHDFGRVLQYLSPEQRSVVIDSMRSEWPNLIQSSYDFGRVLQHLNPEQRTVIIDSMRSEWPNLIRSVRALELLNHTLTPEEWLALYPEIKPRIPFILGNTSFPAHLFQDLPDDQRERVTKLPELISFLTRFMNNQESVQAFASALLCEDNASIKQHLDSFTRQTRQRGLGQSSLFSFFSFFTGAAAQDPLSSLDPIWRTKIDQARAETMAPTREGLNGRK